MGLNDTSSAQRVHIGFFGRRNSGKSSLVNAVTGQALSVVSDVLGTTTDPDAGNDLCKGIIIDTVVKCGRIDIICFFDTRNADRMRSHAMYSLQMLCMHQKCCELISV